LCQKISIALPSTSFSSKSFVLAITGIALLNHKQSYSI
jgi:hypothetical protein